MSVKKIAVIEDLDAFKAWLATTPLAIWAANKHSGQGQLPTSAPSEALAGPDPELLAALKSMA